MGGLAGPGIGGGSGGGVSSLNSLTGALSIVAGTNVTVTPSGSSITISAAGGSGSPGGSSGQVQWNSAGSFAGAGGATIDGSGNLLVTTQSLTDNSTKAASTAFVQGNTSTFTVPSTSIGGTANAITVSATVPSVFTLADGNLITLTPPNFNTSSTVTLNITGTGALPVYKIGPVGPTVPLPGDLGEIPLIIQYQVALGGYLILNIPLSAYESTVSTNQSIGFGNVYTPYVVTAPATFTIAQTTGLTTWWNISIYAKGGAVTVTPNAADSINGGAAGASVVIPSGSWSPLITDANGNLFLTNITASASGTAGGDLTGTYPNPTIASGAVTPAKSSAASNTVSAGITIDGGGSVVTTGAKGFVQINYNCTISQWTLIADQSGSAVLDIKRSTYAGFPPSTSLIGAGNSPTLSSAQNNTAAPSSWTSTTITAGDVLQFSVTSATTVTRLNLILKLTKT